MAREPNIVTAGDLDPSFGEGGRATIDVADRNDSVVDMLALPAGETLVAGSHFGDPDLTTFNTLFRIKADGTPDPTFGQNGVARLQFSVGGEVGSVAAIAIATDHRIYVAGSVAVEDDRDLLLQRHNADGSLDTTFGDGGRVILDVAGREDVAVKVLPQADGRVVVVGYEQRPFLARVPQRPHIVLVRYTGDGRLDPTFGGGGGVVITDLPDFEVERAASAALGPEGKIVIVGATAAVDSESPLAKGKTSHILVARYNPDGGLDDSFGRVGVVVSKEGAANDVRVEENGTILVAGRIMRKVSSSFSLLRFSPNGGLDRRFGKNGVASTRFSSLVGSDQSDDAALEMAEQADGRVILAGIAQGDGVSLARFTPNGRIDKDFGQSGRLLVPAEQINSVGLIVNESGSFSTAAGGSDILLTRHQPQTVKPFAELSSNGRLNVLGTEGSDDIRLSQEAPAGRAFVVTRGAFSQRFATANVRKIDIRAGGGDDVVSFAATSIPATIRGGDGDDTITGSDGEDHIYGDAGDDTIFARDGGADRIDGGGGTDAAQVDDALDERRRVESLLD